MVCHACVDPQCIPCQANTEVTPRIDNNKKHKESANSTPEDLQIGVHGMHPGCGLNLYTFTIKSVWFGSGVSLEATLMKEGFVALRMVEVLVKCRF